MWWSSAPKLKATAVAVRLVGLLPVNYGDSAPKPTPKSDVMDTKNKPEGESLLSRRDIPNRERLIVALDVDTSREALELVACLGSAVTFYKIGLQLMMAGDYFDLLDSLVARKKKVFADLKLYDIPQTVASAVRQLKGRGATFLTVHGNDAILAAAVAEKGNLNILAVTVLTSFDQTDIESLGYPCTVQDLALLRARRALELGCDGVVCSGLEANRLRQQLGDGLLLVTPGVRLSGQSAQHDQKRSVTPKEAFWGGADYIVVGRSISKAPDPKVTAEAIQRDIAEVFS